MRLLNFSERYVIALNFLLIAGCAYFGARAVNELIARRFITLPPPPHIEAVQLGSGPLSRAAYEPIVQRDIFNSVRPAPATPPPPQITTIDLHLTLIGVSLATHGPPYSIIEDNGTHVQSLYELKDQIPNAGQLVGVEASRVLINHDGHIVALDLPADSLTTPAAFTPMQPRSWQRANRDVHALGPGEYQVDRSAVDRSLHNMGELFTQMRALPNFDNGKIDGFKLSEIVPGSLFQQMGLEDGDVVTAIGGQPLNDPTQAIALLNSLRTQSAISMTVTRGGQSLNLNYNIQ